MLFYSGSILICVVLHFDIKNVSSNPMHCAVVLMCLEYGRLSAMCTVTQLAGAESHAHYISAGVFSTCQELSAALCFT